MPSARKKSASLEEKFLKSQHLTSFSTKMHTFTIQFVFFISVWPCVTDLCVWQKTEDSLSITTSVSHFTKLKENNWDIHLICFLV